MDTLTGGRLVARMLKTEGVSTVFTLSIRPHISRRPAGLTGTRGVGFERRGGARRGRHLR